MKKNINKLKINTKTRKTKKENIERPKSNKSENVKFWANTFDVSFS